MEITRITILKRPDLMDMIVLYTDLPNAAWPYQEGSFSLTSYAARDGGEDYVKQHFPNVPYEVVEASSSY